MKKNVAAKKAVPSKDKTGTRHAPARRLVAPPKSSRGRRDGADAFVRQRGGDTAFTKDDLAEGMAEVFLRSATSGEDQNLEKREAVVDEELGGPFVTSPARIEFAKGTDRSNPRDAEREPFPRAVYELDATTELENEA